MQLERAVELLEAAGLRLVCTRGDEHSGNAECVTIVVYPSTVVRLYARCMETYGPSALRVQQALGEGRCKLVHRAGAQYRRDDAA